MERKYDEKNEHVCRYRAAAPGFHRRCPPEGDGDRYECFDGGQTIQTGVNNREILLSNLVFDRGAKPGQGTRCHVNGRTDSSHPGPANEL